MLSFLRNSHGPNMNRFTLSFKGGLEGEFLESFNKKSITDIQLALFIGLLIWIFFGILDANIAPKHKEILWAIRYQFALPVILAGLFISNLPGAGRILQPLASTAILLVELSVMLMQNSCPEPVNISYYAGIILVYMYGATMLRLRFVWAFFTGIVTIVMFFIACVSGQNIPGNILLNNFFFLTGAVIIGMMAAYFMEFYIRREFIMVSLLKKEQQNVVAANNRLEQRVYERTYELQQKVHEHERAEASLRESKKRIDFLNQELVNAQESERHRIAMELHDNVAQDLASLIISCDTMFDNESAISPALQTKASTVSGKLKTSVKSIRNISYDLQPPTFLKKDLAQTLHRLSEEFAAENGISIDFTTAGMERVHADYDQAIHIYRLVQEALHNIKKHANATAVAIKLVAATPHVILRVEDNGTGFDTDVASIRATRSKRMGIRNMETRANLLNGQFSIGSTPGAGTKICVQFPRSC